jgi:hypothetical protein
MDVMELARDERADLADLLAFLRVHLEHPTPPRAAA